MPPHRPSRRWLNAATLCAVAGLAVPASTLRAQNDFSTELQRVAAIRFEGRQHVGEKELLSVMKTKRPSRLPWRERPILRQDFLRADTLAIAAVYRRHGYLDASATFKVLPTDRPSRSRVVFRVHEGERSVVSSVRIEGSTAYPPEQLRRRLKTRSGRPFNPTAVLGDTATISREYQNRGYIPAVAAGIARDSLNVAVVFQIDPGPLYRFGEVYLSVAGESQVEDRLIRRELLIEPGKTYSFRDVERTREQLSETGLFRTIQMDRLVDSSYAVVEWDLRLRERKPRWLDAGVGSGTTERFRFTGEWGHRNLAGEGLQGVAAARLAFDGSGRFLLARVEASLLEPWFLRTRTRGQFTPYYERTTDRSNPVRTVEQERRGITFQLRRNVGRRFRISLTQDNAFVTQTNTFSDPSITPAQRDSLIASVEPSYTTHRLQLGAERDRRDFPFSPGRGSYQNVYGEIAGGPLQGSNSFLKGEMASSWYTPLPNGWVLATRMRAGIIDPFGRNRRFSPEPDLDPQVAAVPEEDRFRLGGVTTVRGFNESQIPGTGNGGLAMLLANLEVRVPLAGPLGAEFYVDAGNVWPGASYIRGGDLLPSFASRPFEADEMRYVYGLGGRLNLPFGPLRIDYTWSTQPDEEGHRKRGWQFAIGPAF